MRVHVKVSVTNCLPSFRPPEKWPMSGFRAPGGEAEGPVAIICSPCADHMTGQLLLGAEPEVCVPESSGLIWKTDPTAVPTALSQLFKKMTSLRNGGGTQTEPKHVTPSLQRLTLGVRKNKEKPFRNSKP